MEKTAIDDLVDCLERDLHNEQEKTKKLTEENERLRAHLLQLDGELTEEAVKRDQLLQRFKERTADLQAEVNHWREECLKIDNTQTDFTITREALQRERQRSEELIDLLREKEQEIVLLTDALSDLQESTKKEIDVARAEDLFKIDTANQEIKHLKSKIVDLEEQVKQVPDLKRRIVELDCQLERHELDCQRAFTREDTIPKALIANLFVNLFDRTKVIDKRPLAEMICNLLDVPDEDKLRMGIISE